MSVYPQLLLDLAEKLGIDLFAGGGGVSVAYEIATGRQIHVAVNHDEAALRMHEANHPTTLHLRSDVFEVCPRLVCQGRPVGFLWGSPDCTDHSKAKGGRPMRIASKKRRALAHVMLRWGGQAQPDVIMMENVEEFQKWAPMVAARCKQTGRVLKVNPDPKGQPLVAAPGERVPIDEQLLVRDNRRLGESFRKFIRAFRELGYKVEWRELRACDYGAPTIRNRWYCIARRDGKPIVWPEPTHGDPKSEAVKSGRLKPWRTAAECIDWTVPMCSIFATREEAKDWGKAHGQAAPKRPLAENTNRRIARGVMRYVVDNPKPYLVNVANSKTTGRGPNTWPVDQPLRTVTTANGFSVVAPITGGVGGRAGQSGERPADSPLQTVTAKADTAVFAPIISPVTHAGDRRTPAADEPLATITTANRGELAVIAPHLSTNRNAQKPYNGVDEPTHTVTAEGAGLTLVAAGLAPRYGEAEGQEPRCRSIEAPAPAVVTGDNGGNLVAAHVTKFRTGSSGVSMDAPMPTVTSNSHGDSNPGGAAPIGVVAANISTYYGAKSDTDVRGATLDEPLHVQGTENRHAVVASFLAQNNASGSRELGRDVTDPLATVTANGKGHHGLMGVALTKQRGTSTDADPADPLDTVSAGGLHHGIAAAYLATNVGGFAEGNSGDGKPVDGPASTFTGKGANHSLVAAHVQRDFGQSVGSAADEPIGAVTGTGNGKAGVVASFLTKYYGNGDGQSATDPVHAIPSIDKFGVVTVQVGAETFVIDDIAMRMLQPRELYLAQGFPKSYIIDRGSDGRAFTKEEQVRMCGNSVCPPVAAALIAANCAEMVARSAKEMAHAA